MKNYSLIFLSALFSSLVLGSVGCGASNSSTDAKPGKEVGQIQLDTGTPSAADATSATPDAGVTLTPDTLPATPDSGTALNPDSLLATPDSGSAVNHDSPLATPDAGATVNPDSPLTALDVGATLTPDTLLASPDTNASLIPDTQPTAPDTGIDAALAPDTNSAPADAAVQFGKTVIFSNGRAVGAMVDWGWVAGGNSQVGGGNAETPLTTFTQPVCPAGAGALTGFSQSCSNTQWPTPNALCLSGNIPGTTACSGGLATCATTAGPVTVQCEPSETRDYGEDWGAMVGVQATPDKKSTLNFIPSSIAATFTGAPASSNIRLFIIIDSISYCTYGGLTSYVSGTTVAASDFSNQCWTTGGTAPASLAGIQKVMLQIDSQTTPVEFANFCFTGIVFQ
jgi:hypothetical protein